VFDHAGRIPAFRGGELLRPLTAGAPFVVVARWDEPAGYDAWLEAPIRAELQERMGPYVDGQMHGEVYEEVAA
jgi:heme-degrading monooxygenase HmoA